MRLRPCQRPPLRWLGIFSYGCWSLFCFDGSGSQPFAPNSRCADGSLPIGEKYYDPLKLSPRFRETGVQILSWNPEEGIGG